MAQQFTGRKLVVIGGSSGMGRQVAADVVAAGGSAVIVGHRQDKVEQTVAELSATGTAWGIAAERTRRPRRWPAAATAVNSPACRVGYCIWANME